MPHGREAGYEIDRLLGALLSMEMPPKEKMDILRDEHHIREDDGRREKMNAMCNLSEDILEKGEKIGRKKAEERAGRKAGERA